MNRHVKVPLTGKGRVGPAPNVTHGEQADPAHIDPATSDARRDHNLCDVQVLSVASSPYSLALRRRRGGHIRRDDHAESAASPPVPATPEARLGHSSADNQTVRAEAAPHLGDAGRESSPTADATHTRDAALAQVSAQAESLPDHGSFDIRSRDVGEAQVPAQAGAGEGHRAGVTHTTRAAPATRRRTSARRGAVGQSRIVTHTTDADSATTLPALPERLVRHSASGAQSMPAGEATPSASAEGGIDHVMLDTQGSDVDPATPIRLTADGLARHRIGDTLGIYASEATPIAGDREARVGQCCTDNQSFGADAGTLHEIGGDAEDRAGQDDRDTPGVAAGAATTIRGDAESGVGQFPRDALESIADPATISSIRELWRRRQAWHRAEKGLTLQAKALCRGLAHEGDKVEAGRIYDAALGKGDHPKATIALVLIGPLVGGRKVIEAERLATEKALAKLAKTLSVAPWIVSTYGVSVASLAAIVGEAGDLGTYANPAKLWKRMGLAVMPDGTRQRRVGGEDALAHGYAPARRSVVWNIGGGLIGCMGRGPRLMPGEDPGAREDLSPYQRVFVRRLRYEAERDPSHARPVTKEGKESFSAHATNRAKRYVEKRFLRDLWREWRRADAHLKPMAIIYLANHDAYRGARCPEPKHEPEHSLTERRHIAR